SRTVPAAQGDRTENVEGADLYRGVCARCHQLAGSLSFDHCLIETSESSQEPGMVDLEGREENFSLVEGREARSHDVDARSEQPFTFCEPALDAVEEDQGFDGRQAACDPT